MFSPRWHKVVRDLWSNKTRTILIVLAIAVGVFAFGSVFATQEILVRDMGVQYAATHPSTITFSIASFDDSLVTWSKQQEEIVGAQARTAYPVRLVKQGQELNMDLYAFPDFESMALNKLEPETGKWPPDVGDLLVERDSLELSGAKLGDRVTVEMPSGRRRQLTLMGTVHDLNVFPASMFPQLSGYISERTVAWLGLPSDYNRLDLSAKPEFDTVPKLEKVADRLKKRLQDAGVPVTSVSVRAPNEHWARQTSESFTMILTVIGIFSLAMSGFLVVNTISALLAEQKRQIGIMKAVGGSARQIMGIYMTLVGVYGLLALVVALPVGMLLSYYFVGSVVNFLNIDVLDFHLPFRVLLLQVVAALAVPLVASAIPILGGVRITVREAISDYGIRGKSERGSVDRLVFWVRFLSRPLLLSLRNTFRRKARLSLTLGTLILAGTLFISVVNVRGSLMLELDNIMATLFSFEASLSLDGHYERLGAERQAESVPGVMKAEGRTAVSMQRIKPDGTKGETFPIIGLDPLSDFVQPKMVSGRWLETGDRNAIVISSMLAQDMPDVQPGQMITLTSGERRRDWRVVGIMRMAFENAAYGTFDYVSGVSNYPDQATVILIRTVEKDGDSQARMAKAVESRLKKAGIGVGGSVTRQVIVAANASQFDFLVSFLLSMAAMTALIGALGLAGMMSLNVMERTREIGVMRSVGASNGAIAGIVVTEGLLVGLLSWALAVPAAVPFGLFFDALLGNILINQPLTFVFPPVTVAIWLGIVTVISMAASLLPAYRAMRMSIRETLAYE